jgi:hypothetical protein
MKIIATIERCELNIFPKKRLLKKWISNFEYLVTIMIYNYL